MHKIITITAIFCLNLLLHGVQAKFERKVNITQGNQTIQYGLGFIVTEDGNIVICDRKAANLKMYDKNGLLIKIVGRKGMGPEELTFPYLFDYFDSKLVLYDYHQASLILYEYTSPARLKHLKKIMLPAALESIHGQKNGYFVAGSKRDKKGNHFHLYSVDGMGKNPKMIMPSHYKFGFESQREYISEFLNKKYTLTPIGLQSYFYEWNNSLYYAWRGNLSILKVDLKTKKITRFGQKTENYTTPIVTPALKDAFIRRNMRDANIERRGMSFISYIFAFDGGVGLIYNNYDNRTSYWLPYLQLYTNDGTFVKEQLLPYAYSLDPHFYCYFQSEGKRLFIMNKWTAKQDLDQYGIVEFRIEK